MTPKAVHPTLIAHATTAVPETTPAAPRHVLGMTSFGPDLDAVLDLAISLKAQHKSGDAPEAPLLKGKSAVLIFEKPSTRTRVSFEVALSKLGMSTTYLSSNDSQLGRGESVEDTALVLSRYADVLIYRANRAADVHGLAAYSTCPVVNALDDLEHPCQIMADLLTIKERRGSLAGTRFLYVGDGANNMANSYLLGGAMAGMHVTICAPSGYQPHAAIVDAAVAIADGTGGSITITDDVARAYDDQDVVATDTWVSMGDEAQKAARIAAFDGYTVDDAAMDRAAPDAFFMHCLPAYYGYECTKDVAHGSRSAVFDEAENRLWAQMAILAWCFGAA